MFKKTKVCTGALAALGGTLLMSSVPTMAQSGDRVEVTGTRIRSIDTTSSSPVFTLSSEEIMATQPATVEEFFKSLPQSLPGVGAGTNNGTEGAATIDLRGLGANRSLVLLDGRRITPFNLTGAVDTNVIPLSLLRRVDVVTGGASTVYGADAVAGVANFVMRKDFQGFQIDGSYGTSNERDANRKTTNITFGTNVDGGRGNVAFSIGLTKNDPLYQGDRPWGEVSRSSASGRPSGSFTAVPVVDLNLGQIQPDGSYDDFENTTTYNFNPLNYYQTALDRTQMLALGNYAINNHAEVYGQALFMRAEVGSTLAPSGTFFNDYNVPLGNPFLPAGARQQYCDYYTLSAAACADDTTEVIMPLGRRFVELGPRLNDFKNTMYQWTAGVRGGITENWSYDLYTSLGKSEQLQTRGNWGSYSKVQQALRALSPDDCTNTANGCVPLNVWAPEGGITSDMMSFFNLSAVLTQTVEQKVISGNVGGDLGAFKSPFASLPIQVVVGGEKRSVTAGNFSDQPSQTANEVLGTGAPLPDRSGTFELQEWFGEAIIPIVSGQPFANKLNVELGYRTSKFTTTSSQSYGTYKYGGEWEPVKGFRFRALQQRSTRAPNVDELYQPLVTGLDNLDTDPCAGNAINQAEAATPGTLSYLCAQTGVPLANVGRLAQPSAGQVNARSGGNPNLNPEESDSTTLGIVFQPQSVPGLAMSLDYWRIKVDGAITTPSVDDVMNGCYDTALNPGLNPGAAACGLVGRSPTNGSFTGSSSPGILLGLSNLGKIETAGWDLGVSYGFGLKDLGTDPKWGRVDLSLNATFIDQYDFQSTPSSVNRDCVGYYSTACGTISEGEGPVIKTRFLQRTTWTAGDWQTSLVWRYQSAVDEEPGGASFLPAYSSIGAYNYFDLGVGWNVNKNLRLNLAIVNLFDKAPPEVGNTIGTTAANSGNTFPQTYDAIGRYFTLAAKLNF